VVIALIDTGVDGGHDDLKGKILAAYHVGPAGLLEVDHTVNQDFHGHGTRIAGLICAGHTVGGVAPGAQIVSIVYPQTADNYSQLYLALRMLLREVEKGTWSIDLLNLSGGLNQAQPGQRFMVQQLLQRLQRQGVLVVAAVGNQKQVAEPPLCPAELAEVLAVGASNPQGCVCDFSRSGTAVPVSGLPTPKPDLVAPGEQIVSCERGGGQSRPVRGTSCATAIVTGVAARYLQQFRLSAVDLRERLLRSCIPLPDPPERQGAGLVRVP
jgi:subtilisin family serine protease